MADYICPECGKQTPGEDLLWRCPCGSPLELASTEPLRREQIDRREASLWRYAAALPMDRQALAATFGEGWTPLVKAPAWGQRVYWKLDYLFPTGSFKDRGTALLVNELARLGVRRVLEDSSGNAGASMATYCARAGIECSIYVPSSASLGKLVQVTYSGANLVRIEGSREETAAAVLAAAESGDPASRPFYASHNWHPLFIEGVKTVGYEIWEQLGYRAPASVVAPVGNGSVLLGLYRAFSELREAGEIETMPRLFAVQVEACAPIVRAFERGDVDVEGVAKGETIAEGIAAAQPIRGRQILAALRSTGGAAVSVGELELMPALRRLASGGFLVEPTAAAAPAALPGMQAKGLIAPDEECVVILTGSGLKATEFLAGTALSS